MNYTITISASHLGIIKIKKDGKTIEKLSRPERFCVSDFDKKIFKIYKPTSISAFGLDVCPRTHKYI